MQSSTIRRKRPRLSPEDATALANYGARTTWPAGFQIYQKGTPADGLSVVLRGHVVLRNRGRASRAFIPAIATPGETFGIEGITSEAVYATDACASDDAETLYQLGCVLAAVASPVGPAAKMAGKMTGRLLAGGSALESSARSTSPVLLDARPSATSRALAFHTTCGAPVRHMSVAGAGHRSYYSANGEICSSSLASVARH